MTGFGIFGFSLKNEREVNPRKKKDRNQSGFRKSRWERAFLYLKLYLTEIDGDRMLVVNDVSLGSTIHYLYLLKSNI